MKIFKNTFLILLIVIALIGIILGLVYFSIPKDEPQEYNPELEKQAIQKTILDYYQGYIDQNPQEIIAQTVEPLSTWEKQQAERFKTQDRNITKSGEITLKDINIDIPDYNLDVDHALVTTSRIMEIKTPEGLGESSNLEIKMKLKKIDGKWKIYDRMYYDMWVSDVY